MDEWIGRWMGIWVVRQVGRWISGWMGVWQADGWMNGRIGR